MTSLKKRLNASIPQKRINSIIVLQRQNDIISMLLEGRESKEISIYLVNKYKLTYGTASYYIKEARAVIKDRKKYEVNNLVSLHIGRYEDLYKALHDLGAHSIAMRALNQKEKLLGFHREGFHMKVTSGEITSMQLQTVDSDYDIDKLDKNKKTQLLELLNKAKRNGRDSNLQIDGGGN